jgi:hypothetical protein
MNYQKSLLIACVVGVLTLSGCAGSGGFVSASASPSSTPTKTVPANGEHYSSVASLKDAFVNAGGDCSSYEETNKVTRAAESGTCGTNTVISVYSSAADRDAVVDGLKQFADMIGMNVLVGENWIVNDEKVAQYQSKLGGTLVTRTATK